MLPSDCFRSADSVTWSLTHWPRRTRSTLMRSSSVSWRSPRSRAKLAHAVLGACAHIGGLLPCPARPKGRVDEPGRSAKLQTLQIWPKLPKSPRLGKLPRVQEARLDQVSFLSGVRHRSLFRELGAAEPTDLRPAPGGRRDCTRAKPDFFRTERRE